MKDLPLHALGGAGRYRPGAMAEGCFGGRHGPGKASVTHPVSFDLCKGMHLLYHAYPHLGIRFLLITHLNCASASLCLLLRVLQSLQYGVLVPEDGWYDGRVGKKKEFSSYIYTWEGRYGSQLTPYPFGITKESPAVPQMLGGLAHDL